jgi:hypothetical protein
MMQPKVWWYMLSRTQLGKEGSSIRDGDKYIFNFEQHIRMAIQATKKREPSVVLSGPIAFALSADELKVAPRQGKAPSSRSTLKCFLFACGGSTPLLRFSFDG